ncbi:hypothetical protein [Marinagarivorans algicola]|uniref:hypothetical protein n=1 Tax=Marinagarivorans algicola TaxID=1513270 RepID=UPI0012E1986D|nr:hypothetical protein [Marinagarivorans algicola]
MKGTCRCIVVIILYGIIHEGVCDVANDSTPQLQLMLNEIQQELDKRGVAPVAQEADTRSQFSRIIDNTSWRNVAIGSVLTAAVTSHPAGLLVGGVAGGMFNKIKKNKKPIDDSASESGAITNNSLINTQPSPQTAATLQAVIPPFSSASKPLDQPLNTEKTARAGLPVKKMIMTKKTIQPQLRSQSSPLSQPSAPSPLQQLPSPSLQAHQQPLLVSPSPVKEQAVPVPTVQDSLVSCYRTGQNKTRKRPAHCFYMVY